MIKSWKARTTEGKSLGFLLIVFFGYIAGIASKLVNPAYMAVFSQKWYILFFYCLNLCMVGVDIALYFLFFPQRNGSRSKRWLPFLYLS